MSKPTSLSRANTDWEACPNCGDDRIEGGSANFDGDIVGQEVSCTECDTSWYELYTALSRVDIQYPEEVDSIQSNH